jgi:hypothetical protein
MRLIARGRRKPGSKSKIRRRPLPLAPLMEASNDLPQRTNPVIIFDVAGRRGASTLFQSLRNIALVAAILLNCGACFAEDLESSDCIMPGCRSFTAEPPPSRATDDAFKRGQCLGIVDNCRTYCGCVPSAGCDKRTSCERRREVHRRQARTDA